MGIYDRVWRVQPRGPPAAPWGVAPRGPRSNLEWVLRSGRGRYFSKVIHRGDRTWGSTKGSLAVKEFNIEHSY